MCASVARAYLVLLALPLLGACTTSYSLKKFTPDSQAPTSAFVDIKQRAVLTTRIPRTVGQSTEEVLAYCAEPSPDALSAFSAELSADAKYKQTVEAALAFAQREASSFIGLRTQTIQLLRDGMYRLCEGYLSGALTRADFSWLQRRYQRNMIALLTIEQLTQVVQAPAVSMGAENLASAARSATAIDKDLDVIDQTLEQVATEETALAARKATADKMPETNDAEKRAKQAELAAISTVSTRLAARKKRLGDVRGALLDGLKSASGLLASGRTTAVNLTSPALPLSGITSERVIAAISEIAKQVLDQDDLGTLCFQLLEGSRNSHNTNLLELCRRVIEARVEQGSTVNRTPALPVSPPSPSPTPLPSRRGEAVMK